MSVIVAVSDREELLRTLNDIPQDVLSVRIAEGQCALPCCSASMDALFMAPRLFRRALPLCIHHLRRVAV